MSIVKISMTVAGLMAGVVFILNIFQSLGVAFLRSGFVFCASGLWTVVMLAAARSVTRPSSGASMPDLSDDAGVPPPSPSGAVRRPKGRAADTLLR